MTKYFIILFCYLFSCFIAVVPYHPEENVKSQSRVSSNFPRQNPRDLITFSEHHGPLATLSEDRRTATKTSVYGGLALVYTNRTLERNELFEIIITEMEPNCDVPNPFPFGVVSSKPDPVVQLSDIFSTESYPSLMIYWTQLFYNTGPGFRNIFTDYLPSLPKEGDKFGVLHKRDGGLRFYFNGVELPPSGGSEVDMFAFVEMHGCYKSVQIY